MLFISAVGGKLEQANMTCDDEVSMTYMAAYLYNQDEGHLKAMRPKPYECTVGPGQRWRDGMMA